VPAYLIAHTSVLEAIAASRPMDDQALAAIRGLGPAKIEHYGAEIVAIVAARTG